MKTIKAVLAGKSFAHWQAEYKQTRTLDALIQQVLAAHGMAAHSARADRLVNGELRLYAASAAAAVSIRQILPSLRESLNQAGFAVDTIRVLILKTPD